MADDIRWLIGIGATLGAMIVAAFYRLGGQVKAGDDELHKHIDTVHQRINTVREQYVRRDDYDKSQARIEAMVKDIRDEQRQYHKDMLGRIGRSRGGQQ